MSRETHYHLCTDLSAHDQNMEAKSGSKMSRRSRVGQGLPLCTNLDIEGGRGSAGICSNKHGCRFPGRHECTCEIRTSRHVREAVAFIRPIIRAARVHIAEPAVHTHSRDHPKIAESEPDKPRDSLNNGGAMQYMSRLTYDMIRLYFFVIKV